MSRSWSAGCGDPASRSRSLTSAALATAALALAALAAPAQALAHGVLAPEEVPLPFGVLAIGVVVVLIVSFVGLAVGWRTPRFEADRWRPLPDRTSRLVVSPVTEGLAGAVGVLLLAFTIWSGLRGESLFSVTFVFVTFWLGLVGLSVVFGDVFRAFNPWRALARAGGAVLRAVTGRSLADPVAYPERLGRWPAAVGLAAFVWLELNYSLAFGLPTVDDIPTPGAPAHAVGLAAVIYTLYTFIAMATFGVETWLRRGETFSVYFGMFASIAPLEVRDGRLGRRPWLEGSTRWAAAIPGSVAVVVAAIALTVFDGARDGLLDAWWSDVWKRLTEAGIGRIGAARITSTVFMLGVIAAVAAIFWAGVLGMWRISRDRRLASLGRTFVHGLIPIGLAYLVAHYFAFFIDQGQAQIALASDPVGLGWNVLGTANLTVNYELLGDTLIWVVQVAVLVAGHAVALALAHDRALAVYGSVRDAYRSQYWMLALMVAFTVIGLILVSELA